MVHNRKASCQKHGKTSLLQAPQQKDLCQGRGDKLQAIKVVMTKRGQTICILQRKTGPTGRILMFWTNFPFDYINVNAFETVVRTNQDSPSAHSSWIQEALVAKGSQDVKSPSHARGRYISGSTPFLRRLEIHISAMACLWDSIDIDEWWWMIISVYHLSSILGAPGWQLEACMGKKMVRLILVCLMMAEGCGGKSLDRTFH